MKIIVIILVLATVLSIVALFLRGFSFNDYVHQLQTQSLDTPAMKVWLLQTSGYHDKMDAYKAGVSAEKQGLGVYVIKYDDAWCWLAGVFTSKDEAEKIKAENTLLVNADICEFEIKTKKINVTKEAFESTQQILASVKIVFEKLLNLREAVMSSISTSNLVLELTTAYNQIKAKTQELQKLNIDWKDTLLASVIYSANITLLSLNDILFGNNDIGLATVNTALLNTIFSLDNF